MSWTDWPNSVKFDTGLYEFKLYCLSFFLQSCTSDCLYREIQINLYAFFDICWCTCLSHSWHKCHGQVLFFLPLIRELQILSIVCVTFCIPPKSFWWIFRMNIWKLLFNLCMTLTTARTHQNSLQEGAFRVRQNCLGLKCVTHHECQLLKPRTEIAITTLGHIVHIQWQNRLIQQVIRWCGQSLMCK